LTVNGQQTYIFTPLYSASTDNLGASDPRISYTLEDFPHLTHPTIVPVA